MIYYNKGINKEYLNRNHIPDSIILTIAFKTDCSYILNVAVMNSKKGGAFGSYTPLELDQYNSHYYQDNETNSASLEFKLFDTKDNLTENKFKVTTKINPFIINDDGSETRINPTTEWSAITKAFEKGIKQLKKELVKNDNKI